MSKKHLLEVSEFHAKTNRSEVARVDILNPDGKFLGRVVVQHLATRNCIVVDLAYSDSVLRRIENFYYE